MSEEVIDEPVQVWLTAGYVVHDAEPMTKAEIIARREEALRIRYPLRIVDEATKVTPEMWCRYTPWGDLSEGVNK